jgi:gamma-glutamyl-gamma-aminobutyrate hydrolase PuuD
MNRIGILCTQKPHPDTSQKRFILGLEMPYVRYFERFGKVFPIFPGMTPEDINLDLLILPGGQDLDPSFYSEEGRMVVGAGSSNPLFSQFFHNDFNAWREAKVPMLGICLGFQAMNVMLGGKLTPDGPCHSLGYFSKHPVVAYNEKLGLYKTWAKSKKPIRVEVNSRHHQFIGVDQLASGMIPVAMGVMDDDKLKSDDAANKAWYFKGNSVTKCFYDKNYKALSQDLSHVEAAIHATEKLAGVQWHPEDLWRKGTKDSGARCTVNGDQITDAIVKYLLETPVHASVPATPDTPPKYQKQSFTV